MPDRLGGGPERAVQVDGRPALVWRPAAPVQAIATTVLGGGIGLRSWLVNAEVPLDYAVGDPAVDVAERAAGLGLVGAGIGFLTAARVLHFAVRR